MSKTMTSYQASKVYNVDKSTISERCRRGTIPANKAEKNGKLVWIIDVSILDTLYTKKSQNKK